MVSTMLSGAGSVARLGSPDLAEHALDLGGSREERVLARELPLGLLDREPREGGRHVEDVALVQLRHELAGRAS